MTVGLVVGVGFDPSPQQFQELMDRGLIKRTGFQYVTLELTADDAADRAQLKSLFQAACLKQGWEVGAFAYADMLTFAEVMVGGQRAIIVEPEGFDEPEADPGGIVAGIGFKPSVDEMRALAGELGLRPGYRYVAHEYAAFEATSEYFLAGDYIATRERRGWREPDGGLSVHRVNQHGKEFVVVQPSSD